jgi:mono/diheme cytochrome c family protein
MNNTRTYLIEALIGLGAMLVIVTALGLYMLNESSRIDEAQTAVLDIQLDEAMTLYAENCSVCHGLDGEGIGATPPLNTPGLQTMAFDDIYKIISRGRYDTAMPAWSKEDGGPLSDYQIEEMVALIQYGDWNATGDRVVNLGLAPLIPFTTDPDPVLLVEVGYLPDGPTLQTAIQIFASNCVACHGADGLGTGIAPALNDPLVRVKTAEELSRTITFGNPGTLMAGWSNVLTADEINAMITLIQRWDEVPAGSIPAPNVPVPTTAESIALGNQLYSSNCSRCHGPEGQGTPRAPSLNVKSFLTDTSDQAIQQIITLGIPGTAMPVWGDRMTDAEIQAIVGFIRQWEANAPEVAQPLKQGGGGPPWLRNQTQTTTVAPTTGIPATTIPQGSVDTTQATPQATAVVMQQQSAHQPGTETQGGGGPPWSQTQSTQTEWWQVLDWRILALIGAGLAIAFTLISAGLSSLRKRM